jgi:hypothetical protein
MFETRTRVVIDRKTANFFFLTATPLLLLRGDKAVPDQPYVRTVERFPGEKTLVLMAFGSPVVFSGTLRKVFSGLPDSLWTGHLLDQYEIDFATGKSAAIFIRDSDPAPAETLANPAPNAAVNDFVTRNKSADMTVSTDAPAFVRLPFSWHPSLRVSVNGRPVVPRRDALDFVLLKLETGENRIHLEGGMSNLRKILMGIGLAALAAAAGLAILFRRREA